MMFLRFASRCMGLFEIVYLKNVLYQQMMASSFPVLARFQIRTRLRWRLLVGRSCSFND